MPVAYFCPWRPPKQGVSGAVSERDDHVSRRKGRWFESNSGSHEKGLYQNDYSDLVAYSTDFMSQNEKKRKKTPPKGAKSKGYTALAKKYSDLNGFKPKVCREVENRCDCS